jgi:DNA-binding phage protein
MTGRTAAEEYLRLRRQDPEYAAAYEAAARRVSMFDEVVRELESRRTTLGLTKAELAKRAGMPPAVVRRLFSQQHKNPTLTTLVAIAEALGLTFHLAPDQPAPIIVRTGGGPERPSGGVRTRRRTA